jgi:hypothetical protein
MAIVDWNGLRCSSGLRRYYSHPKAIEIPMRATFVSGSRNTCRAGRYNCHVLR